MNCTILLLNIQNNVEFTWSKIEVVLNSLFSLFCFLVDFFYCGNSSCTGNSEVIEQKIKIKSLNCFLLFKPLITCVLKHSL